MRIIGIIGAGTMGTGVAQCFADKDYNVVLVDVNEEILIKASRAIHNISRFQKLSTSNGNIDKDPDDTQSKIRFTTNIEDIKDAEFIVENIYEDANLKMELYQKMDKICPQEVIFAANTSCISITQLASYTNRHDRVIGIHFMNPVNMIQACEVIKGYHTSEDTLKTSVSLLSHLGKESIVIEDYPGFVSNRISHLMMNEAAFIVQEGYASAEDIDAIFTKCYGHKMGILQTADIIGIDTVYDSLNTLYYSYKDSKFRCCPLIKKMVDANLLGRKTGEGFYKYY